MSSDETNPRFPDDTAAERPARRTDEARGPLPRGTPPKFGRYETWRVLGAGAFGRVYLAFDDLMERFVAIKAPKDALPTDKHRAFLREARAISEIHHPHVCPVYDVGIEDDLPFLVMKFVRGGTLADLVEREPPTPVQALKFVGQIAQGLEAVHARGIFHRDLKPANVLYDAHEKKLLLTDFGLARWTDGTASIGGIKGTPLYMAPEQWAPGGEFGDVSARTDIYALGVMLFEFLTGERLFDGPVYSLGGQHCMVPPRKPSDVRTGLGARYDALCAKALAKKQDERHASARALAQEVSAVLRAPAPAPRTEWAVNVPGLLFFRPAGEPGSKWREVGEVPNALPVRPGTEYRVQVTRRIHPEVSQLLYDPSDIEDADLAGLSELAGFDALRALSLEGCAGVTDAGTAGLARLTGLTELVLASCERVGDATVERAAALDRLEHLDLSLCGRLTDAGAARLRRLVNLRELFLAGCERLTDAALEALGALARLEVLHLSYNTQFTNDGLRHVGRLERLRSLDLRECAWLTDAGLRQLEALPALEHLYLIDCPAFTDAGFARLAAHKNLKKLWVQMCRQIGDSAVAALQAALPDCQIIR